MLALMLFAKNEFCDAEFLMSGAQKVAFSWRIVSVGLVYGST
jgi:hypothetical protein